MPTSPRLQKRLEVLFNLEHGTNQDNVCRLQEQLASPLGIVPFVGAGMSIPCGMPGWSDFLMRLATRIGSDTVGTVQGLLKESKFEEAAQHISNELGDRRAFPDAIEDFFGDAHLKRNGLKGPVLKIPALSQGPVLTTNFDRVLEKAFDKQGQPFQECVWGAKPDMLARALHANQPYLVKLHGDVLDRTERILTLEDYKLHYGSTETSSVDFQRPLPKLLKQIFTGRTLLFLGCSLEADRTVQLLRHVAEHNKASPPHYAILELPKSSNEIRTRARFLSELNIRPLWFPNGEFGDIDILLEALISQGSSRSQKKARTYQPRYLDEENKRLGMALDDARRRKQILRETGLSTAGIDGEIQSLRLKMREGGQLRAGDWLAERYQLLEPAGEGGFAKVWKAYDSQEKRPVAVKVLHPQVAEDPVKRERFFSGAQKMKELAHQAIVPVLEPKCEDGRFYFIVMELIEGGDLNRAVKSKRINSKEAIDIVLRIGEVLALAHSKGFTHRDVKPSNILLDVKGSPYLTDFDLLHDPDRSMMTKTNPMGTWGYGAPEVFDRPQEVTPSADVYSLGMTVLFCLRGNDLFHSSQNVPPSGLIQDLGLGSPLEDILLKAIQHNPKDRFANAAEFCKALRSARAVPSPMRLSPKTSPTTPSPLAKRGLRILAGVSLMAAVVGGSTYLIYPSAFNGIQRQFSPPPPATPSSTREDQANVAAALTVSTPTKIPASAEPSSRIMQPFSSGTNPGTSVPIAASSVSAIPSANTPSCPEGMKRILAGKFTMGAAPGARAVRTQSVSFDEDFCMDKTEVTVGAYEACVNEKVCTPPASSDEVMYCSGARVNKIPSGENQGSHPITCVKWKQADDFCRWATKRLPTEGEWEYAARGPQSTLYPWGDQHPGPKLLNACDQRCSSYYSSIGDTTGAQKMLFAADDGYAMTSKVESYPDGKSHFGLQDMAGNVSEWVDGKYCDYKDESCSAIDMRRVARGGSWRTFDAVFARASYREALQDKPYNFVGFRCAMSLH